MILASLISGNHYLTIAGTGYVNLSMFLAFAVLFPDTTVLLFFIIPVKMKWLAALDGQVFLDETEDTYCVWRTEYRRGLCTYYMDLFTLAEDGSWDRSFELHRQRGYSVEQLTRWLEEAGFADVRTWGDGKLRRPVPGEDRVYFTCIRK